MTVTKFNSPLGILYALFNKNALIYLDYAFPKDSFLNISCENKLLADLLINELEKYFSQQLKEFSIPIELKGSKFQLKVWQQLFNIHYGEIKTYGEIAKLINGCPRAVGGALNKNPISIIVPCHRVLGANKKLIGYAGGIERKKFLLQLEQVPF